MLPSLEIGSDTLALGLPPSLEGRIAKVLLARYRSDGVLGKFFAELDLVESEALLELTKGPGGPVAYLAFNDSEETLVGGGRSMVVTAWKILMKLPVPAQLKGPDVLELRSQLTDRFKGLTYGDNPGVIENDNDPGNPLAYRLAKWGRVDASELTEAGATLRSLIAFLFESKINTVTREVC